MRGAECCRRATALQGVPVVSRSMPQMDESGERIDQQAPNQKEAPLLGFVEIMRCFAIELNLDSEILAVTVRLYWVARKVD